MSEDAHPTPEQPTERLPEPRQPTQMGVIQLRDDPASAMRSWILCGSVLALCGLVGLAVFRMSKESPKLQ